MEPLPKVVLYDIIYADSRLQLIDTINSQIRLGWYPIGGPQVAEDEERKYWFQGMMISD